MEGGGHVDCRALQTKKIASFTPSVSHRPALIIDLKLCRQVTTMNQPSRLKFSILPATAKYGDMITALNLSAPISLERNSHARTFAALDWQEQTSMLHLTDHRCTPWRPS